MKEMTNRTVIMKNSAIAIQSKINILVTDLVRVMRNVSPLVKDEERKSHIQYFMHQMQFSGYSPQDRQEVYNLAKKKFHKIINDDHEGVTPMYRSKSWNQGKRNRKKVNKVSIRTPHRSVNCYISQKKEASEL